MANRRLAKGARSAHKKKAKSSRKEPRAELTATARAAASTSHATFFTGGGPSLSGNASRLKISAKKLKGGNRGDAVGKRRTRKIAAVTKKRSALRKQHQVERMTLKEHIAELERRRLSIRKGDSAKQERRELGKYIRQLKEEQEAKHAAELASVEAELKSLVNAEEDTKKRPQHSRFAAAQTANEEDDAEAWEDVEQIESDDSIDEDRLQDMFAHLIA